jgi:maleylpyruvate isomerase
MSTVRCMAMTDLGSRPTQDLSRVAEAHRRFVGAVTATIDDAAVARPSLLPGWSIGHVMTHVARNADSHRRRAEAAAIGHVVEQYDGGYDGRAAEIETGATRSARALIDDVRISGDRLASTWLELPFAAWEATTRDVGGRERPLNALPARRWQELEVHVVDLGVGVTHLHWSSDFVFVWLPRLRASAPLRLAAGINLPDERRFTDDREELAWLYGRLERPDLPVLAPWG